MKFDLKKNLNKNLFFHFNFLNINISLIMKLPVLKVYTDVKNTRMEGTVSQIFYLGLSFYFI